MNQKKVALWNKRHFEEKNRECAACLKYSVLIFVEKIHKMQHLEGSVTPVLYIGRTVLKGYNVLTVTQAKPRPLPLSAFLDSLSRLAVHRPSYESGKSTRNKVSDRNTDSLSWSWPAVAYNGANVDRRQRHLHGISTRAITTLGVTTWWILHSVSLILLIMNEAWNGVE